MVALAGVSQTVKSLAHLISNKEIVWVKGYEISLPQIIEASTKAGYFSKVVNLSEVYPTEMHEFLRSDIPGKLCIILKNYDQAHEYMRLIINNMVMYNDFRISSLSQGVFLGHLEIRFIIHTAGDFRFSGDLWRKLFKFNGRISYEQAQV